MEHRLLVITPPLTSFPEDWVKLLSALVPINIFKRTEWASNLRSASGFTDIWILTESLPANSLMSLPTSVKRIMSPVKYTLPSTMAVYNTSQIIGPEVLRVLQRKQPLFLNAGQVLEEPKPVQIAKEAVTKSILIVSPVTDATLQEQFVSTLDLSNKIQVFWTTPNSFPQQLKDVRPNAVWILQPRVDPDFLFNLPARVQKIVVPLYFQVPPKFQVQGGQRINQPDALEALQLSAPLVVKYANRRSTHSTSNPYRRAHWRRTCPSETIPLYLPLNTVEKAGSVMAFEERVNPKPFRLSDYPEPSEVSDLFPLEEEDDDTQGFVTLGRKLQKDDEEEYRVTVILVCTQNMLRIDKRNRVRALLPITPGVRTNWCTPTTLQKALSRVLPDQLWLLQSGTPPNVTLPKSVHRVWSLMGPFVQTFSMRPREKVRVHSAEILAILGELKPFTLNVFQR